MKQSPGIVGRNWSVPFPPMKTKFAVAAGLLAAVCAPVFPADSAVSAEAGARVEVTFVNPEKFTDVKDSDFGTERQRDDILALLKEFLVERAPKLLPEGQVLSVTITDIDMAGDFEPWRGPKFNDVRIVKDLYPPRIDLTFKVTDASGAVVKEGTQKLRDMSFQMSASPAFSSDSLRYEKALLDGWLRSEFPKVKAAKEKK
ncbi:hypothetical protein CMV30_08085 [Nibricoccus aquaticus]|uniref:DUF3016 domain-containing protein n=2 Tax=Nibricoccus aquaticus TaxID=2576891 RepID=A0A290QJ50_9BACT|nr:hypothetical protein CMV30_08085 [Nibricoccus aquaticus]